MASRARPSAQSSQTPPGAVASQQAMMSNSSRRPTSSATTSARAPTPLVGPILLLLFLTTVIGSLYSTYTTSNETLTFRSRLPTSTLTRLSNEAGTVLPYFADKRNIFNQYFVKRAWGWITSFYLLYSLSTTVLASSPKTAHTISVQSPTPSQHVVQITRRYLLSTLYWYYLTQRTWFGALYRGPSITRQILLSSGATCVPSHLAQHGDATCTGQKGEYYQGGHDTSGHTFMMVHATLFLYHLVAPSVPRVFGPRSATLRVGTAERTMTYAIVALIGVSWFMLLCTSLFFHSPAEKLSGFAFGLGGWVVGGL